MTGRDHGRVTPYFTTLDRRGHGTVAHALDHHSCGSPMFLVFPELSFTDQAQATAAQVCSKPSSAPTAKSPSSRTGHSWSPSCASFPTMMPADLDDLGEVAGW
jgi:hypothetical protein